MKIGLLSDTHGYLDPKVLEYFASCDEVWHAGDIGSNEVADALERFKPFKAVYGNVDDRRLQLRFPEDLRFTCDGLKVLITHIGGRPPLYNPRIRKLLDSACPDLLISGHSHILQVRRDALRGNLLFLNPGAAGNHGFHQIKTVLRFEVTGGEILNMEAIELGKRGEIPG